MIVPLLPFQSLVELTVLPPQSFHSGCGSGPLSWGLQPQGEGVLAGEWSGFPWSPICVVRSKGPGSALPMPCHPVQTRSAQCLSTWCSRAQSTHLAATLTPLWLNPLFFILGLDHFPA